VTVDDGNRHVVIVHQLLVNRVRIQACAHNLKVEKVFKPVIQAYDSKMTGRNVNNQDFENILKAIEDDPDADQAPLEQITVGSIGQTKAIRPLSNTDCKEIVEYHIPTAEASLSWHHLYMRCCKKIQQPPPPIVVSQYNKKLARKKKLVAKKKPSEPATMLQPDTIRSMGLMSRCNKPDLVEVSKIADRYGLLGLIKQAQAVQIHSLTVLQYEAKSKTQQAAGKAKTDYELAVSALESIASVLSGDEDDESESPSSTGKAASAEDGGYDSAASISDGGGDCTNETSNKAEVTPEMLASPQFTKAVEAAVERKIAKRNLESADKGEEAPKRTKVTLLTCEAKGGLSCGYMTCPVCRGFPDFDDSRVCTYAKPCKYTTCTMCSNTKGK